MKRAWMQPGLALLALGLILGGCDCEGRSLRQGDVNRHYLLHLPQPRPEGALPLLISLHGRLGTGNGQRRATGFNDLADRDGVAVVYPDGVDRSWADARDVSPAHDKGVDDEAFLLALIKQVGQEIDVDPDRVTMMGISNGGFMTQTMACRHGQVFAGVASVISTMPSNVASDCSPARPLSVMFVNGTEDPLVPFEGGTVNSDVGGEITSSDDAAAHWVTHNQCGSTAQVTEWDQEDDDTLVRRYRYDGCAGGSRVDYIVVEGGGHTWPGGSQYLPEGMVGRVSHEIESTELIWEFLMDARRAPAF